MAEMKVLNIKEFQTKVVSLKTAESLNCLLENLVKSKVGPQAYMQIFAMVGNHAQTLLQGNPTKAEHAALSALITEASLVTASNLEIKYSGNGHSLKAEAAPEVDYAGYHNDYSVYTGRGVSNSG